MMRFLEASRRSNDSAMNYSRGNTVAIKEQVVWKKEMENKTRSGFDEQCGIESNINNSGEQRGIHVEKWIAKQFEVVASPFRMMH